jgi:hypothetical protein
MRSSSLKGRRSSGEHRKGALERGGLSIVSRGNGRGGRVTARDLEHADFRRGSEGGLILKPGR